MPPDEHLALAGSSRPRWRALLDAGRTLDEFEEIVGLPAWRKVEEEVRGG
jgi:hypothetical protein